MVRERFIEGKLTEPGMRFGEIPVIETWEELVEVVSNLSGYFELGIREHQVQSRYDRYGRVLKGFGLNSAAPILRQLNGRDVALIPNRFPYGRLLNRLNEVLGEAGQRVDHMCVWNCNGQVTEEIVERELADVSGLVDWVAYVHPPKNRSIPQISHSQVFMLVDVGKEDLSEVG